METTQEQKKEEQVQETTTAASTEVESTQNTTTEEKKEATQGGIADKAAYFDNGEYEGGINRNTPIEKKPVAVFSYGGRVRISALFDDHEKFMNKIISVAGWARTTRMGGKDFAFIELTDGSGSQTLQVVIDSSIQNFDEVSSCTVGASFKFKGTLIKSPAKGQLFELQVSQPDKHSVHIFGKADGSSYQLSKKRHTNEFLRDIAHLRPRTKLISAVTRVRNNLSYATHKFFQERGFQYIHTPIITASDCEGAGEMFQVTTVMPDPDKPIKNMKLLEYEGQAEEEAKLAELAAQGKGGKQKKQKKDKKKKKEGEEGAEEEEEKVEEKKMIPMEDRKVNYRNDFFGKPAFLTVSGQLSVENFNCAIGDCYTFGPTFRAENSHTSRHLAEFWMIEPELAFATLEDDMDCGEDYIKYCLRYVMENNADDIDFFNQWVDKGLKERLNQVVNNEFKRITYTDCLEILDQHMREKKIKFKVKVTWGMDMNSEHERYLCEQVFKMPIIVYDYPKSFKAFYMRQNDDGKTVQAMDILVPGIGELIGGSAREERLDRLEAAILEKGLELEPYWWYRELRKYGTMPHAGFGLGFERLVMMATGVENIRDVIPFPRVPGRAEF